MKEEYIKENFSEVDTLTAVCRSTSSWLDGEYEELEVGKTYKLTHIGVYKSSSKIMLSEFPGKEYNSTCFDIYENGEEISFHDPRFWPPCYVKRLKKVKPWLLQEGMEKYCIPSHLADIEKKYDVKILLAVESGSRAWGFESENSDWDVRFIYVHKTEWYFKIEEQRDVIEHVYEDDVDLVGWELRKALSLLRRCNPSLLEWLHSPIIYYMDEEFGKRIHEIEKYYFNPVKSMYHYNRIYNKHNERYLQKEEFPLKKFLYYLRGVLACQWIEKYNTIPPVSFHKLYTTMVTDDDIREKISKVVMYKKKIKEQSTSVIDAILIDYARNLASHYNASVGSFRPDQNKVSADALDSLLYDMVKIHSTPNLDRG